MPNARRSRPAAAGLLLPVAAVLATALAACDGTSTVEGVLAPSAISGTVGGGTAGGSAVAGRGIAPLQGSWTRVASASPGVLVEQTFVFAGDGTGTRVTVTRTALGVALAAESQRFSWTAGAGVLSLRFDRPGAATAVVRASYQLLVDVTGTVLRLDGQDYLRTGG